MHQEHLTVQDLIQGYREQSGAWHCLRCGECFQAGEIYRIGGRLYEAARAVQLHIETAHAQYQSELIDSDTKYNTLTENQRHLFRLFAQGLPDKEIARILGITPSTVRHHRFQFREKAKQARHYLAVYESVMANEKGEGAIMPIHEHAKMVDQRYVITEQEREHVLRTAFLSLQPLRLRQLSPREKKKVVILAQIAAEFAPGRSYTEREVNDILRPIFEDYVTLRRYLIEYGFMDRSRDGSDYRRTDRA